jgi:hypothetical protein
MGFQFVSLVGREPPDPSRAGFRPDLVDAAGARLHGHRRNPTDARPTTGEPRHAEWVWQSRDREFRETELRSQEANMDELPNDATFDAGWLRLRDELMARIAARFGQAFETEDDDFADPEILADLALQRAFTP